MNFSFRTRRRLRRLGIFLLCMLFLAIIVWFCWVLWVERYIVYTREGATIDFNVPVDNLSGEVAVPPVAGNGPGIHYNEGENAINTSTELTQLNGYYITGKMLTDDLAGVRERVAKLERGTPVMIELKSGYGSFYYSSNLEEALISASVDVVGVDALLKEMAAKNLYLIARVPAFRDYTYALNHVSSGITYTGGGGALWLDSGGCFWMKPTDSAVVGWISSVVLELRNMGFKEVILSDFRVPEEGNVIYNGDRTADLLAAANTLLTTCTTSSFTLSFGVSSASFPLPEGRSRMYLENVVSRDVEITAQQVTFADPLTRLVFVADSNDTRYDAYGVLRSLDVADELEEGTE